MVNSGKKLKSGLILRVCLLCHNVYVYLLFPLKFYFILEGGCITVRHQFQVSSRVIQLCVCIYSFSFRFFSHVDCYRILNRVPCAVRKVPVGYLFLYIVQQGLRSLVGYSPWGRKEADTTE